MMKHCLLILEFLFLAIILVVCEPLYDIEGEPHPDPNDENYAGMAYIGRRDDDGRRVGFDADNGKSFDVKDVA